MTIGERLGHGVQEAVDRFGDVLLGEARPLGDLVHDIGLRHHFLLGPPAQSPEFVVSRGLDARYRNYAPAPCQSRNAQGVTWFRPTGSASARLAGIGSTRGNATAPRPCRAALV